MILVVMRGSDDEQDGDGYKTPFPREATEPVEMFPFKQRRTRENLKKNHMCSECDLWYK